MTRHSKRQSAQTTLLSSRLEDLLLLTFGFKNRFKLEWLRLAHAWSRRQTLPLSSTAFKFDFFSLVVEKIPLDLAVFVRVEKLRKGNRLPYIVHPIGAATERGARRVAAAFPFAFRVADQRSLAVLLVFVRRFTGVANQLVDAGVEDVDILQAALLHE